MAIRSASSKARVAARVRAHRDRLRAQGLRPVQFWLPDTSSPEFRAEAARQSALIAGSPHEKEDQAFVDSVSIWNDDSIWGDQVSFQGEKD